MAMLGALVGLDVLFNLRYPAAEPAGWTLLPSLDAVVLLGVATIFARRGRRMPRGLVIAAAVLVVAVRLFRVGDGITLRYFNRPLSLGLDLPLSTELVRLLDATMPRPLLIVAVPLALALLVGTGVLAARLVRLGERGLGDARARAVFMGVVLAAAVVSLVLAMVLPSVARPVGEPARLGAFGRSALPRLVRETAFALRLDGYRAQQAAAIAANDARLRSSPRDLRRLGGVDVLLFFVESYGATVLDRPEQARLLDPVFVDAEAALRRAGFAMASSLLDSPTYAGRSWLAHETLSTGARTGDRIADEAVQAARPVTLARFFRDAGYRTVFAQPANRYRTLSRWLYDFEAVYSGWDFDYRGPAYRWANMPDQYTIDFIHRHEVAPDARSGPAPTPAPTARAPLLVAYALVTSHAPWSDQPRFIADWSRIGDGSIYATSPTDHFPISWTTLARGGPAYVHSLAYDLRVIVDYLTTRVAGDALVIALGDHQPVGEVTGFSASPAVPIHVISRRRELVSPFLARGYLPGMRPRRTAAEPEGLETFLPHFLADFSTGATDPGGRAAAAGRAPAP